MVKTTISKRQKQTVKKKKIATLYIDKGQIFLIYKKSLNKEIKNWIGKAYGYFTEKEIQRDFKHRKRAQTLSWEKYKLKHISVPFSLTCWQR